MLRYDTVLGAPYVSPHPFFSERSPMRAKTLPLFLAALFSATAAPAAMTTLLTEGFSSFDFSWASTAIGARLGYDAEESFDADHARWTARSCYKGRSGVRMGLAGTHGYLISPEVSLAPGKSPTELSVSFYLTANNEKAEKKGTITFSIVGTQLTTPSVTTSTSRATDNSFVLTTDDSLRQTVSFPDVSSLPTTFRLKIEAGVDARLAIDQIVLTEVYEESGPVPLLAPASLAASGVTDAGFSLTWGAVADAAGYAVEVLDGAGASAGTVAVSGAGAAVTGLAADTAYTAKVKALAAAGSTAFEDSDWSVPLAVRTTLPGGSVRAQLFKENFTGLDNGWTGTAYLADDEGFFSVDEKNWFGRKITSRRDSVAVGLSSDPAFVRTRDIGLTNNLLAGSVDLSFYAVTPTATASRKAATVKILAIDAETGETNWTGSVVAPKLSSTDVTDITTEGQFFSATLSGIPETFFLRFETDGSSKDNQFAIDAVLVEQIYLPHPALAVPVPIATNATMASVEAEWPAVAGAAGYAVERRDAATGVRLAFDPSCAATNRVFDGLAWGHDYDLRVRALGDGAAAGNSPWSEPVRCRTLENAEAPTFLADATAGDAVMACSEKAFGVAASRDGANVPVRFDGRRRRHDLHGDLHDRRRRLFDERLLRRDRPPRARSARRFRRARRPRRRPHVRFPFPTPSHLLRGPLVAGVQRLRENRRLFRKLFRCDPILGGVAAGMGRIEGFLVYGRRPKRRTFPLFG